MKHFIFSLSVIISLLFITPLMFAQQNYFYCNNTYIYPGDSLDKVKAICGAPLHKQKKMVTHVKFQKAEQWIYNFQPNSGVNFGKMKTKANALIINFINNKIHQIFVEGQPVTKTYFCRPDVPIKIGDTGPYVYELCMWPNYKQDITLKSPSAPVAQIILTYQPSPHNQPTILHFENGKLVDIE